MHRKIQIKWTTTVDERKRYLLRKVESTEVKLDALIKTTRVSHGVIGVTFACVLTFSPKLLSLKLAGLLKKMYIGTYTFTKKC